MPRRYGTRKKRTRRRYKRRRRYAPRNMGIPSGMPLQRIAKLRYCEQITLTSTLGAMVSHAFSANGLYDPNLTGTGHQPMGYDQWAGLFNHYVVLGSKLTMRINSDGGLQGITGVYLSDDTTIPYSDGVQIVEAKRGGSVVVANQRNQVSVNGYYSAKKFFNVKDVKDNLARLGASVTSNPTEQGSYIIYFNTLNGTTESLNIIVQIDYICLFSEPVDLAQS